MIDKVNLAAKFALLDAPYRPGIVGHLNDYKLQIVKLQGPFVWHKHEETDDFFLVISGHMTIHLRDRDVELGPGELFVVPRGVEHCPEAVDEAQLTHGEVFIVLTGTARFEVEGRGHELGAGDAICVPPQTPFTLSNDGWDRFTAICCMAAGGQARIGDGEGFPIPWAQ